MCSGQVDILRGKCALVTGGNSGIGKATALLLARRGAKVVLACRNERACRLAAEEIRAEVPGADLETAPVPLDLSCLKKVRRFAESILATYPRLHLLVNNAGVNTASGVTEEGVVMMSQVNYLGPYALTRLLEGLLCRSAPAAVVNLSSVTHRAASLRDPQAFLYQHRAGSYAASKLANTLFTFELHRRIRTQVVHSCAVDPGGVQTGIWRYGMLGKPPLKWVLDALYAPPSDAARVVLAASIASLSNATGCLRTDSAAEAASSAERAAAPQFFARGTFALPAVTAGPGPLPPESWLSGLRLAAWGFTALLLSMMDWPVRRFSGRRCLEATRAVPPAPAALDESMAHALWAESASICDLPHDVQH